jgi:hypothetical protein
VRVTSRADFVARTTGMLAALDSVLAFTITVTDVAVRGDSAEVAYREHIDARVRPPQAGAAAVRDSSTSWWRDRWVRTPAGWRAVRFERVPPPNPGTNPGTGRRPPPTPSSASAGRAPATRRPAS